MILRSFRRPALHLAAHACAALLAGVALSACGKKEATEKPATQTAAKVNKEEITVHQINALLSQQRAVRPEQADDAARRVLERLIDQELALQKASELKVDRDPRVVQLVEAARREIVARAYAERLSEGAPRPTPAEIKKYYDDNPALFKERRIYQLQELAVQAQPAQVEALRAKALAAKSFGDFVAYLKANGVKFAGNQSVRAAEQIPLSVLPMLAGIKDGGTLVNSTPTGAVVVHVASSRFQPLDEERAAKAIELFLLNERKRKLVGDDLKALRAAAKIEYAGRYAAAPAPPPEAVRPMSAAEVAASAAAMLDAKSVSDGLGIRAGAAAASAVEAADANVKAASAVDSAAISKGLGIK